MIESAPVGDRCVLQHKSEPDRPRRALPGLYVCAGHHAQLERTLDQLPGLHDELGLALRPENAWQRGVGQKTSGTAESTRLNNSRVEDVRDNIRRCLASWCRVVVEDRELHLTPRDVQPATTSRFLRRHLEWLCARPPADERRDDALVRLVEFAGEMMGLASASWALIDASRRRRINLGQCAEITGCCWPSGADARCAGIITATLHGDEGTRATDRELPDSIDCTDCGASIPAGQWYRYGERIKREGA